MKKGFIVVLAVGLMMSLVACALSEDEVRRIADESAATAVASVLAQPTITPQPTTTPVTVPPAPTPITLPPFPTPLPTATPVTFPATATPQPTPTPIPTATPQPTPTPVVFPPTPTPAPTAAPTPTPPSAVIAIGAQVSSSSVSQVTGAVSLKVSPENPLAGRDIAFTLAGLEPWQPVDVEFVDPQGQAAEWITDREFRFSTESGLPVTSHTLYADEAGGVSWLRIATNDIEGEWSMRLILDEQTTTINYSISQLQLPVEQETVGVELRRYQGLATDTYYSALVPATLAVDLQGHLSGIIEKLEQRLGVQSTQIPDIYLMGNRSIFEQVGEATGSSVGAEPGFFRSSGTRPGIYMRTDYLRTAIQRTLNHEYVHLVLGEEAGTRKLPAWLNEGGAEYYELELGLEGERPDATRLVLYGEIDLAKSKALSGALMPLTSLEDRSAWNSRAGTDNGQLQYAQAHMAVRYMTETYGAKSLLDMVRAIENGSSLAGAFAEVLGSHYLEFEQQFRQWLQNWEDPRRTSVRAYTQALNSIMEQWAEISARRAADLGKQASLGLRVPSQQLLVTDTKALLTQLSSISPPSEYQSLHQSMRDWLESLDVWLTTELQYLQTSNGTTLAQANGMIPEVSARELLLNREISAVEFVYNLD